MPPRWRPLQRDERVVCRPASRARKPTRRAKPLPSIVFLLGAASFVVVAVMTVTAPLLPLIARDFAVSVGAAGVVVSAFAVPYGAFQIVFGPLGDRLGKLKLIAVSLAVSTLFVLASGLSGGLESLAVMRFLSGATMAGTVPLAMAWIADEVPYERRQLVIGRYINGLVLGQIAGGCIGGLAAEYLEWRQIFLVFAALCALASVLLWRAALRIGERPPAERRSLGAILAVWAAVLRRPRSRAIIVVGTLEGIFIFGVAAYYGAFLRQTHGLGYALIGLVLSMYGVGGLIYSALIRHVVRRLGERRMILGGALLLGSCYLLLPHAPHWWLTPPLLLFAGFGFYTLHNTLQTLATELDPNARGTALSLWVFMIFVGQGFGVTAVGRLVDARGYTPAFTIAGLGIVGLGVWFHRRLVATA